MGYDLRHLLIGSEGTLGLITAASLRLYPAPAETATAWVAVASPEAALALLHALRRSARRDDLGLRADERAGARVPGRGAARGSAAAGDGERAGGCWSRAPTPPVRRRGRGSRRRWRRRWRRGWRRTCWSRRARRSAAVFWGVRETIPEANRLIGAISSHDISLPPARLGRVRGAGRARWWRRWTRSSGSTASGISGTGTCTTTSFRRRGGAGSFTNSLREPVKRAVHDLVHELGGSVGAEHGVGRLKVADLVRYGDPAKVAAMRAIKKALGSLGDPEPGRRAGLRVDCAPSLWGGGEKGRFIQTGGSEFCKQPVRFGHPLSGADSLPKV